MRPVNRIPAVLDPMPPPFLARATVSRRTLLRTMFGAAATLGLAACGAGTEHTGPVLAADAALPTTVPSGTSLAIASTSNGLVYQLSGIENKFPFTVSSWVNVNAGPDVINAFRAHSLDLGANAGIPPIQAHYQGDDAKIVSVAQTRKPNYLFITKPHSDITSVADFRGKKLAFSQGQAQGVVLLRALQQAGISNDKVQLVPLTSDQFLTALEAGQVDVAVSGISIAPEYLNKYASEGARSISTNVVDFLTVWWAPSDVLQDADKVAAIREFIQLDAQAKVWQWTHPSEWIQEYYVKLENLSQQEGEQVTALTGKPWIPEKWDAAIKWEQVTADLLAGTGFVKKFDVSVLFDRRFEGVAAAAVPATYRT
jgi:sulfonate transport system substrate-binding protein